VFDEMVEGTDPLYTSSEFDDLLASATSLILVAVATNVSGTDPTLFVGLEQSPDRVHWIPDATGEIDDVALTTTVLSGDPAIPRTGFGRLKVLLGGTSPKAHITIWVTGHDDNPFSE
jgi:hypothetical protein